MDLRVLGPLEAVENGQSLPLRGMKQRTVLALLIGHGGIRFLSTLSSTVCMAKTLRSASGQDAEGAPQGPFCIAGYAFLNVSPPGDTQPT